MIQNKKFLRKFNPYTPPGWAKQTDTAGPATLPPAVPAPDALPRPVSPPSVMQAVEPVGNYVSKWATPTQVENPQLQEEWGQDDEVDDPPVEEPPPAQPGVQSPERAAPPPRRSLRKNKGQTTKFQDYVGDEELPQQFT